MKYLYRAYHKKEYNQLKRFSEMNSDDVWNLGEGIEFLDFGIVARVLVMASAFNIELDESCSLLYLMLEKKSRENSQPIEKMREGIKIPEEIIKESTAQVNEWASQNTGIDGNIKMRVVKKAIKFIEEYMAYERYPRDIKEGRDFVRNIQSEDPLATAKDFYNTAAHGGIERTMENGRGMYTKMQDGTILSFREKSASDGTPVVEINIKKSNANGGVKYQKIHFIGGKKDE